jgi:hypothetical protein
MVIPISIAGTIPVVLLFLGEKNSSFLESPEFSVLVFMPGAQAARLHPSPKPMTIGPGRVRASQANAGFNCKTGRRAACAPGKCDGKNPGLSRSFIDIMDFPGNVTTFFWSTRTGDWHFMAFGSLGEEVRIYTDEVDEVDLIDGIDAAPAPRFAMT